MAIVLTELEFQADFFHLIARVEAGETFLISRNGRPVARMIGPSEFDDGVSKGIDEHSD